MKFHAVTIVLVFCGIILSLVLLVQKGFDQTPCYDRLPPGYIIIQDGDGNLKWQDASGRRLKGKYPKGNICLTVSDAIDDYTDRNPSAWNPVILEE